MKVLYSGRTTKRFTENKEYKVITKFLKRIGKSLFSGYLVINELIEMDVILVPYNSQKN